MLPTGGPRCGWPGNWGRRFGVARWLFHALSATDAKPRGAAHRAADHRPPPRSLVFQLLFTTARWTRRSRYGTQAARRVSREGNVGTAGRSRGHHHRGGVQRTWTPCRKRWPKGTVACVLAEPAMTNMGIILCPTPAITRRLRELTRAAGRAAADHRRGRTRPGRLGPGGCTAGWGLDPDLVNAGQRPSAGRAWRPGRWGISGEGGGPDAGPGRRGTTRTPAASAARLAGQRACRWAAMRGHAWGPCSPRRPGTG